MAFSVNTSTSTALQPLPIRARQRSGKSPTRLALDGMRLFLPVSAALLLLGAGYYAYTFLNFHRFTNMSALLLMSSLLTVLIGILGELVSSLHYKEADCERRLVSRDR